MLALWRRQKTALVAWFADPDSVLQRPNAFPKGRVPVASRAPKRFNVVHRRMGRETQHMNGLVGLLRKRA